MGWHLARRTFSPWRLLALVGRRRWSRVGRRHMAVLRLRRFLCSVGARLWLGKRLRLSVWRLRLWRLRLLLSVVKRSKWLGGESRRAASFVGIRSRAASEAIGGSPCCTLEQRLTLWPRRAPPCGVSLETLRLLGSGP